MLERSVGENLNLHLSPNLIGEAQQGNECVEGLTIALEELVRILDAELDQYRELLYLLRAQREHFTVCNITSFEEISKRQETVVLKIKTLEEARKSIVRSIAQYFDIPHEGITLAKLAGLVDKPYSERCIAYQEETLSLIRDLESLRESNAYLIQHTLHYVSGVLKIFASSNWSSVADSAYSNNGQLEHKTEKGKHIRGWV